MNNFVTIFPFAANVHLIKDVGQIANTLGLLSKYNTKLVCYKQEESYSFLETEARYLTVEFIEPSGRKFFLEKAILNYIQENAMKIDILHFFHLTKETIYYTLHFKKYNPKGKVYVKLDIYNEMLKGELIYSKKQIFNWYHKKKEALFFKNITVISVENPTALRLLGIRFPFIREKALLIPNGVNDKFLKKEFPIIKTFEQKENIIVAVGRIGAKDKNFELLLNAFAEIKVESWKLIFVGPTENNFEINVQTLISENDSLKGKIELTGVIEDRIELYEYYNRSKICCLTSPFESFGITFIEAMYFGNFIIGTSGMSSLSYITNAFELGLAVEHNDKKALIEVLNDIMQNDNKVFLENNYQKAIEHIKDKFYWSKIVEPLISKLDE